MKKYSNYNALRSFFDRHGITNPGEKATQLFDLFTDYVEPSTHQIAMIQLPPDLFDGRVLSPEILRYIAAERNIQADLKSKQKRPKAPNQTRDNAKHQQIYRLLKKSGIANPHVVASFLLDTRLEGSFVFETLRTEYGLCPNPGDTKELAKKLGHIQLIKWEGSFNHWFAGDRLLKILTPKEKVEATPANDEVLRELAKAQQKAKYLEAQNSELKTRIFELEGQVNVKSEEPLTVEVYSEPVRHNHDDLPNKPASPSFEAETEVEISSFEPKKETGVVDNHDQTIRSFMVKLESTKAFVGEYKLLMSGEEINCLDKSGHRIGNISCRSGKWYCFGRETPASDIADLLSQAEFAVA